MFLRWPSKRSADFRRCRKGGVSILAALAMIPILGVLGMALDYGRARTVRTLLQGAVDAAALAALNKFEADDSNRPQVARDYFERNIAAGSLQFSAVPNVNVSGETATVSVTVTVPTMMLGVMNITHMDVAATATAIMPPEVGPVCVLALDPVMDQAISLKGGAQLSATGCVVHANSRSDTALASVGSSLGDAGTFCAVGGHMGDGFMPTPNDNCSLARDPFAGMSVPDSSICDYHNKKFHNGTHTAQPGVYCGGLTVHAHAEVTLSPGVYVIKDGPLWLHAHSTVSGNGVVFYLVGDDAILDIKSHSNVNVTASTVGPYAGLVFIQDPDSSAGLTSSVEGGGTIQIVGGFYLPTQALDVGGGGTIGATSPYMPMVAKNINFHGNAIVTINLDASAGMPEVMPNVRTGLPRLTH